jgi:predicted anti-sigma-YlaC factor YlaD
MNGHLSDEQWAAAALNQNDAAAAKHLAECAACREEVSSFAGAVGAAQAQARAVAEQPEAFWRQQRESIGGRVAARDFTHPWRRSIWVAATVMLILLASTLLSRNNAPPAPSVAQTDPDDALLLSVQQSIQSDVPQALRPAALLTAEIDRASVSRRHP